MSLVTNLDKKIDFSQPVNIEDFQKKPKTKVVAAILLCDRKAASQMVAIPAVTELKDVDEIYINIETYVAGMHFSKLYNKMILFLQNLKIENKNKGWPPLPTFVDAWSWKSSGWKAMPQFDQDQHRLFGIVTARNMCRTFALEREASHMLFVDADVVPPVDTIPKLLAMKKPLVGGIVPGRGEHSYVKYIFGRQSMSEADVTHFGDKADTTIVVRHGTMGLCMIERVLLTSFAFRYGVSREDGTTFLSEDPAFAQDVKLGGFGPWYLNEEVEAAHIDNPKEPLTQATSSDGSVIAY